MSVIILFATLVQTHMASHGVTHIDNTFLIYYSLGLSCMCAVQVEICERQMSDKGKIGTVSIALILHQVTHGTRYGAKFI